MSVTLRSFSRQSSPTFGSQRGAPGRPGPIDNSSLIIPNSYKVNIPFWEF